MSTAEKSAVQRGWQWMLWFLLVAALVFVEQTWHYWRSGPWLAGIHADGPFHFYCELSRLAPDHFPNDLAVQSNQSLGYYETTYRAVAAAAKLTGWPLLKTNLILSWTGNVLYLAGVMMLLRRLGVGAIWGAVGTLLAAQPYVLIMMSSGVVHSLVIPRELWLWPMPWLVTWFAFGQRTGGRLVLFYGVLGAAYGFTYPLWAALFGLAFGLADGWQIVRSKKYSDLAWLAAGGGVCLVLVAAPALAIANTTAGGESAVLDYNQIPRTVYASKGLRRFLLFVAVALAAFWFLRRRVPEEISPWRRLFALLVVTTGVCLVYEPFLRLAPSLSLLYPGRLSLVTYLVSVVAVAGALHFAWRGLPRWGQAFVVIGLMVFVLDPTRHLYKDWKAQTPPMQTDFVEFCRRVRQETPLTASCIVPPEIGGNYFRVYAERGLWINPKDMGVLSRTRVLYAEAQARLRMLNLFYAKDTTAAVRENTLNALRAQGLTHVVTRVDDEWAKTLSWPVLQSQGGWQLRASPTIP
jgi:hypothetical protein